MTDDPVEQSDIEAFFTSISSTHPGPGNYAPMDRYRDFRALFLGTDQGKRVLHEILCMGRMISSSLPAVGDIDTTRVIANEGRRSLALSIFNAIHAEPAIDRPVRSNNRPDRKPKGDT